jgi:carbon starvation protein
VKMHRARYMWITCAPLVWLLIVTYTASLEKIFSELPRVGFLAQARQLQAAIDAGKIAAAKIGDTKTMIFNAQLDAALCVIFLVLVTIIVLDSIRIWAGILQGTREAKVVEAPFVPSQLRPEEV